MIKVVINEDFGGFGLSDKAWKMYCERTGGDPEKDWDKDIPRDDPILVEIVETLGKEACDNYSSLKIVEIPDDADWYVEEYDGREWIAERHRRWS